MKEYIHYGHLTTEPVENDILPSLVRLTEKSAVFNKGLFNPIKNTSFTKPDGGYWASPVDSSWGWKDWCEVEDFSECKESNSFRFTLKEDARVLL